jgi:hypothetical protein
MSIDEQFARILRDAAELAPHPPGERLAAGAERLGRRRRLRRRGALAGGMTAVVLCSAAATLLAPGPTGPSSGAGRINGAYLVDTLTALLPPGKVTDAHAAGPQEAIVTLDDGHGPAMFMLSLGLAKTPLPDVPPGTPCPDRSSLRVETCARSAGPDGSVTVMWEQLADPLRASTRWNAVYTRADGRQVRLSELDGVMGGSISRAAPLADQDRLKSVVESSAWDRAFRAATGVVAPTTDPRPDGR